MSHLNMAIDRIHVWVGVSHLVLHWPPWVWVILFDFSSAHWLVTMTLDHLNIDTAKSTVVPPICSREVDLCKNTQPPSDASHKISYPPLSRVNDVGNTMAHLWSRSLPVDFSSLSRKLILRLPSVPWSLHASMAGSSCLTRGFHHWPSIEWFYGCSTPAHWFTRRRLYL